MMEEKISENIGKLVTNTMRSMMQQSYNDGYTKGIIDGGKKAEQERADIERELSDVPVAISHYGAEPGGGASELNAVEREASRRIKLGRRVAAIEQDTRELRRVMQKVENAIRSLDAEEERLITLHYIDGRKWYEIADELAYSETSVKQKGYRAIGKIAVLLFGSKAGGYEQVVLFA